MYNILICDDERDIVNALKIYLTDPDYRMFEAYTGREALEIVEREDIHLILMDIMMPEMDGISAMVKIRESCNVPVILLTAKSEDMDKILGLNAGADDYITKPFNPIEVADNLKKGSGFIPGIRPGKPTSEYLNRLLNYIIFVGAVGLTIVGILPFFFRGVFNANVDFGGTSLIIVVSVILETIKQVESLMVQRNYTTFLSD